MNDKLREHRDSPSKGRIISKVGIVIANTGSPEAPTSEAVARYLRLFLSDPLICPMNPHVWSFVLDHFIIPKRAPVSAAKYASIWTEEGSPLDVHMASLAKKLGESLQGHGVACVLHASSYSSPSLKDALGECKELGCDQVIVVPLYPQSAFSTTSAVRRKVDEALTGLAWNGKLRFVESYCDEDAYIDAIAASVRASDFGTREGDRLLFAFHSIPVADIRAGDTYGEQTQRTAQNVARKLSIREGEWRIGYQCRFDKSREWLGPFTAPVLQELSDAKRLFVIAPNFSVDCLETLFDIQCELCEKWQDAKAMRDAKDKKGREEANAAEVADGTFRYIPCLNDSDVHVNVIRSVILKAIES